VNKSLIRSGVRADKIEVIPSCIDKLFFEYFTLDTNIQRKLKETNSKTPMVLFVGNLDKAKGLDVFLNAAKSLLHINPMIRFVITLHEPNDTLEKFSVIASRKLGSSVVVKGVVKDMAGLMSRADVVVVPFRSTEGISDIPLIVLEAMALGKSVVASKLEGIEEIIRNGDNGFLVEPSRPDELADTIVNLLNDSDLSEKIGERAALSVKQFSYKEVSQKMSDLYFKVLEEKYS
jgi:glycosyltransferase involved in cell wall biosynthesis